MTENSFVIEVTTTSGVHRITFLSRAEAEAAFDAVEPKVGHKFSNDPEMRKHTIRSHDGALALVMADVQAIRVIDDAAFSAGIAYRRAKEEASAKRKAADTSPEANA